MFSKPIFLIAISFSISVTLFAQSNFTMKSINKNAPIKCSKTVIINASSEKVWTILTSINDWSRWQTDISNLKLNGELAVNTTFDWKTGGVNIHSTLHAIEPCKNFGWTGKAFGLYAIHNWTLSEFKGQTTVTVNESMEGFIARLFKKSFNKNLEKWMLKWLYLLKQECEK